MQPRNQVWYTQCLELFQNLRFLNPTTCYEGNHNIMPKNHPLFPFVFILILTCSFSSLTSAPSSLLFNSPQHIFVNNRILAKVNNKPISVIDLMKKMDMVFYKQFPQYASSVEARYQFYQMSWKAVLEEMIDKELFLADAEEVKLTVSQGDIRQEMESLFGPNIIANLDKAGLTFEEASQMIKEDLMIQKILSVRIHSKVMRTISPQKVRDYYVTWAKNNSKPEVWKYQVISIRGKDSTTCAEVAHHAHQLLTEKQIPISSLSEHLKKHPLEKEISCTVSELFEHTPNEISEAYREGLTSIQPNSFSAPLHQKGRSGEAFRLFYLKDKEAGGALPLQEVENLLRDELAKQASTDEAEAFMVKLRKHFAVQLFEKEVGSTEDFQPFSLK